MNNLSGQNLGRYHVIEPLGQGGMASVFKAYDTALERYIAIKVIRTDVSAADDSGFLARFRREAKALAQLDHPYILKVLDYGEQDGTPYLVMPFEPGGTLKEKMGRPIPYQEAAATLALVARALEYAHNLNIIHRDVKPANILISHSGAPLLSDFGIAKILESGEATQLTATGVGIGTPDYMAPEQWMGTSSPQTDIYSLGVVLYEMVTGHRPFTADTPAAVLIKHLRDPLPRPKSYIVDLPEAVELVLFKALAKEAGDRFQNMGAFAAALEQLALDERIATGSIPTDIATVLSPVTTLSQPPAEKTVLTSPTAPKQKPETWKMGLVAIAAIVELLLICVVLGGGTFIASRLMTTTGKDTPSLHPTAAPTIVSTKSGAADAPIVVDPASVSPTPTVPPSATATPTHKAPFLSIEGFPEDVPFLKDNNGDLSTTVSQDMTMYSFSSNLTFEQAFEFYKTGMEKNGWKQMSETTQSEQVSWVYQKGQARMVMVSIAVDDEGNTRIVVMLAKIQ